jgi:hypothetical protein
MKIKIASALGSCALVFGVTTVQAVPITGSVGLIGSFTGAPFNLTQATSITLENPRVASVTPGSVLDTSIDVGQAVNLALPLNVAGSTGSALPLPAGGVIYSVGGFTLTLSSLKLTFESASNLVLDGVGTLSGNGFDPSPGNINLTFSRSGQGPSTAAFTFAGTSASVPATTPVADGGATALLLGLGLLGVASMRRRQIG